MTAAAAPESLSNPQRILAHSFCYCFLNFPYECLALLYSCSSLAQVGVKLKLDEQITTTSLLTEGLNQRFGYQRVFSLLPLQGTRGSHPLLCCNLPELKPCLD